MTTLYRGLLIISTLATVVARLCAQPSGARCAEVFAYHTDAGGTYAPAGAANPWRLKGWAITDPQGRFEFRTIRPAPDSGRDIPAHVHTTLTTGCRGHQFDDLMFDDDRLATKPYRNRFAAAGEHGLYGAVTRGADGAQAVSYTIRIREHGNF